MISYAQDELAGRGLYYRRKAKGERREALQQQVEVWEALLEKLGGEEDSAVTGL